MNKTKIEWCDFSINPVRGLCPVDCKDNQGKPYCYARRMYKRFKWNPEIRFANPVWLGNELNKTKPGSRIFWGSTFELFHDCVPDSQRKLIFDAVRLWKDRTHIFLTKRPQNLPREWPDNCWVGVSATDWLMFSDALGYLASIHAKVKFISFEPLLKRIQFDMLQKMLFPKVINWLIIGQCTPAKASTQPKIGCVKEIVEAADKAGVAVFLKNNLRPLLVPGEDHYPGKPNGLMIDCFWADDKCHLRQEWPK